MVVERGVGSEMCTRMYDSCLESLAWSVEALMRLVIAIAFLGGGVG